MKESHKCYILTGNELKSWIEIPFFSASGPSTLSHNRLGLRNFNPVSTHPTLSIFELIARLALFIFWKGGKGHSNYTLFECFFRLAVGTDDDNNDGDEIRNDWNWDDQQLKWTYGYDSLFLHTPWSIMKISKLNWNLWTGSTKIKLRTRDVDDYLTHNRSQPFITIHN